VIVKTKGWLAALLLLTTFAFFDVSLDVQFALPQELLEPDPDREALYSACYAQRDVEIHRAAFGTIDNPDVQKEYINSNRRLVAAECRAAHPQSMITVATPFRFSLFAVEARYW
jgi:hypothetical protein